MLEWILGGYPAWAQHTLDGPIGRLSTTDTDAGWLVQLGRWSGHSPNTGKDYADEPSFTIVEAGEPSFTVAASARDLDAWLWNRPTVGAVEVTGDAARFEEIVRAGVQ